MPMHRLTLFKRQIQSAFGVSHAYAQADAVRCDVTPMSIRSLKSLRVLACPSNGQGHPLPNRASFMGFPLA